MFCFFRCQLKHKIWRETLDITFYRLIQRTCSYSIHNSQISVKYNPSATEFKNLLLYN